jgi:4-amino-4-deoxy-L-arabinose transferase-like glycosyltransferase
LLTLERLGRLSWEAAVRSVSARPALLVYCLAFSVRLAHNLTAAGYRPIFDAGLYDAIARNLINRHCYCIYGSNVTVSRAPLWPGIIAAIYAVFGQDNLYARLFLCLLGAGTCVIVYRFARDLFGARTGLLAGVIAAVYTGLFLYDGWLYTEALYTFCVTGFTYALYRVQVGGQSRAGRRVALIAPRYTAVGGRPR